LKNAFVIVTLSGLLAACAVAPAQQDPLELVRIEPAPSPVAADTGSPADDAVAAAAADDPTLPKVQLTKDLLYRLMKAELDLQAGDWRAAYMSLMNVAQQTRDPRLARRAAEIGLQAHQAGESLAAVRLWRELAPASDEASQAYLGLSLDTDDLGEAERIYTHRLAETPASARPMAMYQAQQYLSRARSKAAASALLDRLLAPYADTFEARVLLSQNAYVRGDNAAARKLAQSALELKPDSEIAVLTQAQVTEAPAEQSALLSAFLHSHPGAREVRSALARLLVSEKRYAEARKQFDVLLKQQPDNTGTLYAAGFLAIQLGDRAAAEKYLSHYVAVFDRSAGEEPGKILLILSSLAEERGDLKSAMRRAEQVGEGDTEYHFAAQLRRAQLMAKQGNTEAARTFLASLRPEEAADQARLLLAQSQILRDAGQLEAAYAVLDEGAKRHPANPDLLYDFALLAEKTGRLDIMESTLRSVMVQVPDNHHAYNALGYSLAERNVRLPEALELVDKALKMAPDDPFIMDSLGWVHYRMGNLDQAETYLRRAYALRNDVEIGVHLGEVLWHKGQKADAQKLWREARAKDPKNDTLKSTLARLHQKL
jgi:tetratricopeptide (TPR) repeat protein